MDRDRRSCKLITFPVGILRPRWLIDGVQYLGDEVIGGIDVHVFTQADFITYYEGVVSKQPVKWIFQESGAQFDLMSFEVGVKASSDLYQAPNYCFNGTQAAAERRLS